MVLESSTVSIFLGIYNAPGVELGEKAEVGIGFAKGWRGIHDREPATVHFERAGGCNKELDGLCAEAFDGRGIQRQKCGLGNERLDLCIEVTHGGSVEHISQIVTNFTLFERRQIGLSAIYRCWKHTCPWIYGVTVHAWIGYRKLK